jgi:hypothetical protein
VDGDAIDVGVVDEPDDLIGEKFSVVLRRQVRLGRLRRVELKTFADALSQDVQGRIGLHDLGHRLLNQWFGAREPVAKSGVKVVRLLKKESTHKTGKSDMLIL